MQNYPKLLPSNQKARFTTPERKYHPLQSFWLSGSSYNSFSIHLGRSLSLDKSGSNKKSPHKA
jgi:hypothetical protein